MSASDESGDAVRLDKWLWAARFYKTRAQAAEAVAGGKVKLNGERVKASKTVRVEDALTVSRGPYEYAIRVLALSTRRGPASQAALLYQESAASQAARQAMAERLTVERAFSSHSDGRPSKKDRRQLIRFKKTRAE